MTATCGKPHLAPNVEAHGSAVSRNSTASCPTRTYTSCRTGRSRCVGRSTASCPTLNHELHVVQNGPQPVRGTFLHSSAFGNAGRLWGHTGYMTRNRGSVLKSSPITAAWARRDPLCVLRSPRHPARQLRRGGALAARCAASASSARPNHPFNTVGLYRRESGTLPRARSLHEDRPLFTRRVTRSVPLSRRGR
jgi:hypothetical protein